MTAALIFSGIVHIYLTNHAVTGLVYMSSLKTNYYSLTKSVITMVPLINLHATDTATLYSLLSFVTGSLNNI